MASELATGTGHPTPWPWVRRLPGNARRYPENLLKVLTSVSSEPEAELISARLSEAGIQAIARRSIGGPEWGVSGARDVYVEEHDLVRAREILAADESVSEDELADLSDAAPAELQDPGESKPSP
jgi:hypothetical protein